MRIAVNTRFLLKGRLEGIGWFTHEILKRMVCDHPEHEFIFLFDRPYDSQFVFAPNVTPVVLQPPARHPVLWYLWFEWSVPQALKKFKPDLFISTDGFLSLRTKVPTLLVVHDLAFEHYPEHLPLKFRYYLRKFTPLFVKKATHIVTVSSFSKQDLIQTYGAPADKIDVIYNGAHNQYKILDFETRQQIKAKYAGGCEYFVFAGALHPRKNIVRLLQAFTLFKRRQRSEMKILIIGRFAWNADDIRVAIQQHPFAQDVLHYDYMQVEELSRVIGAAYALTFVSLFEGFGIPILEAIKCRVPSIVSNVSSMPEVAGNSGICVDPSQVEEIARAMCEIYKNEPLRNQLADETMKQAAKFSWNQSAAQFYTLVEKLCSPGT